MKSLGKILLSTCFCLLISASAFADQQTTVLTRNSSIGAATLTLPYIDGNLEVDFEKMANNIINTKAAEMLKRFGNKGEVDYTVSLNRPSVVSILLRASYDGKTIYDAVNVDLTSGREFGLNDFFVNSDKIKEVFGKNPDILFGEQGIYKRNNKNEDYEDYVPYKAILPFIRIGEAGRLLQIARLTKNVDGKILHMKAGNVFAMKLDANPSTGYSWNLKPSDKNKGRIVKVGSSFMMPAADDTRVGTPGTEIIMFAVGSEGTYNVTMEYKRPWEMFVNQSINFTIIAD